MATSNTASNQQHLQSLLPSSKDMNLSSTVSVSPTIASKDQDYNGDDDKDDDDQDDSDTMSRAVDDVMAYVDHLTFSSGKVVRLPFTPKRSDMDNGTGTGTGTDVNAITNKTTTMTTTSALLDRTNTLFPDMTPFHKRKNPNPNPYPNADARTPLSPMNIRRRPPSPLSPAMEPTTPTITTTTTTSVTAMGADTASEIPSEIQRVQEGEPSESTSVTTTTAVPETNETESEKSSQDEIEIETTSIHTAVPAPIQAPAQVQAQAQAPIQAPAPSPQTDPYQCQCQNKCRYEQQAWEEREKARNWARDLRTSVQHWVQQQKECLACERDQAQQSTHSWQHQIIPQYQAALDTKEQEVRNLHQELQQSRQHHESVEQKLYEVIQYQQTRLQQLELEARKQELMELEARTLQTQQHQQQQPAMMTEEPTIPSKSQASSLAPAGTGTGTGGTDMSTPRQVAISPEAAPVPTATTVPPVIDMSTTPRSRLRRRSEDGTQFVTYGNGSTKEIHTNGTTVIRYPNGDVKTYSAANGTIAYHYAASKVTEVRKDNDASNTIFEFPNGQVEQHWNDGRKIVSFPDGTTQRVAPDGSAETVLAEHPSSVHVEHSNGKQEWLHVAAN
jgi:hypothetical protein